jgi:F1F0 ATPase subunit 2
MNETMYILIVFICGVILGVFFFGGLWLTVKKGMTSKMPGLLFIASFFIRTLIALVGFYYLSANNWKNMAACLMGFVLARFIIKQYTKSKEEKYIREEVAHEA